MLKSTYTDINPYLVESINDINIITFIENWVSMEWLARNVNCPFCSKKMKIRKVNWNDSLIFRCFKKGSHDVKKTIRLFSVFEKTRWDLRILYYWIFSNFVFKIPVKQAIKNISDFRSNKGIPCRKTVMEFYRAIIDYISKPILDFWKSNPFSMENRDECERVIEWDECIYSLQDGAEYYLLAIRDTYSGEVRMFCLGRMDTICNITELVVKILLENITSNVRFNMSHRDELTTNTSRLILNSFCSEVDESIVFGGKEIEIRKMPKVREKDFSSVPIRQQWKRSCECITEWFGVSILKILQTESKSLKQTKTKSVEEGVTLSHSMEKEEDAVEVALRNFIWASLIFEKTTNYQKQDIIIEFMQLLKCKLKENSSV